MKISEYLTLIKAGYKKAEIDAIVAAETETPPAEPKPAEQETSPDPKPAETAVLPDFEKILNEKLTAFETKITQSIQNANISNTATQVQSEDDYIANIHKQLFE